VKIRTTNKVLFTSSSSNQTQHRSAKRERLPARTTSPRGCGVDAMFALQLFVASQQPYLEDPGRLFRLFRYQISRFLLRLLFLCSDEAERKFCVGCGGSTRRTQGILAGMMNGRSAMSSFKSGGIDPERKDGNEDRTGTSISNKVSCGVLGGEWEGARM